MEIIMSRFLWYPVLLVCLLLKDCSHALRLLELRVPKFTIRGDSVLLECSYDLENEALYSVKWYKDGREFYRFIPRDMPPAQVFVLPGISVNLSNSTNNRVILENVELLSSGRYYCEVSAEAPSFQTISNHSDMMVVVLPEKGPTITGGKSRYQIGEQVHVNCTSGQSKPAAQLTWFINGEPAEHGDLVHYKQVNNDGLETSILGLKFRIKARHFKKGDMKLKCLATIASVYWKSNEESAVGDKIENLQRASILESKKPLSSTSTYNTRADRVHANKGYTSNTLPVDVLVLVIVTNFIFM